MSKYPSALPVDACRMPVGGLSLSNAIVESGDKEMAMAGLSAVAKNRITAVLDSTYSRQHGFTAISKKNAGIALHPHI
jgi:hypothetical protein